MLPAAVFLTVLLAVPFVLLGSETVARRVMDFAAQRAGLELRFAGGSLWSGIRFERVSWKQGGTVLLAEDVAIDPEWSWGCLLRSTVCITRLDAARVVVSMVGGGTRSEGLVLPEAVALPVGVAVQALAIEHLAIIQDGEREDFYAIRSEISANARRVRLSGISLRHRLGTATGQLRLGWRDAWPVSAAIEVALAETPASAELPQHWEVAVEGTARSFSLKAGSPDVPAMTLASQLTALDDFQRFTVEAQLTGFDRMRAVQELRPWLQIGGPVALRAEVGGVVTALQLQTSLDGLAQQPLAMQANLSLAADAWRLDAVSLTDDSGAQRLSATGRLGLPGRWLPELAVTIDRLDLPAETGVGLKALNAWADIRIVADAEPLVWELRGFEASGMVEGRAVAAAGSLSGAGDQPLFPVGEVEGSVDGLAFSYERAPLGEASLTLPEGIEWQQYALASARLRVSPGETTRISLAVTGDIATQMRLAVTATARGASWRLSPFTAEALGERVRSESAIAGNWDRERAVVAVDDFCLHLRGSRVCGDSAQLGESGSLRLMLVADESITGKVGDNPYGLSFSASGELSVEWTEREFTEAALALTIPALTFDPFLGSGTAESIRFDDVSVNAAATPARQSLDARAASVQAGGVTAALAREGDAISGELRFEALQLAAFNDLLPELDLIAGAVEGLVTLGGSLKEPEVSGELRLSDGRAALPGQQNGVEDANLALSGSLDAFTLRGDARLGDGPIHIEGQCCFDGSFQLVLEGERNQLQLPEGLDVTISPALTAAVEADRATIRGTVRVHSGTFEHSGPLAEGVAVSNDVVRIDQPLSQPRRFDLDVDVRALIDAGFTLRSKELEATLAGDLRLMAEPGRPPQLFGELQVLGGVLRAYGQGLRLERGRVGFAGDPLNPGLDLSAVRDIRGEQLTVGVRATGSLEEPSLALFSEPSRSERETLSYLLRGRGPDSGAGADGTAMALALGASAINQTGFLNSLNSVPGLSQVTLGAEGSDDEMAATISAYVGERLYLSYGMGIYEPVNALTARLYLRSRIWLEVVSRLENSFDVYYRFDRD